MLNRWLYQKEGPSVYDFLSSHVPFVIATFLLRLKHNLNRTYDLHTDLDLHRVDDCAHFGKKRNYQSVKLATLSLVYTDDSEVNQRCALAARSSTR